MPDQVVKESYWDAVKQRLGELAQVPINAGRKAMAGATAVAPTDPNLRPGVPEEALPGGIDPQSEEFRRRQAVAAALAQSMQGSRPQQPASAPQIQF